MKWFKLWILPAILLAALPLAGGAAVAKKSHPLAAPKPDIPIPFVRAQETKLASQWLASTLSRNKALPFSFDYDGKPSSGFLSTWTRRHTTTKIDAQRTRDEFVYTDPATKLTVRCESVRYADYPAVEWTVYFHNKGPTDTPLLANIQALDLNLTHKTPGEYALHYSTGSHAGIDDFQPQQAALTPSIDLPLGGASGWSTTEVLSYFNVAGPDSNLLIGIGWPGNWKARFTRDTGSGLHILAGQGLTHFVLHPGEEARSPLIALQFYTGDWIRGQNLWRRWMVAHNLPRVHGQLPPAILAAGGQEIEGILHYNETAEKSHIDLFTKRNLQINYWWIDAGWYPCNGNWPNVGTWIEDKAQFPDGLRTVTDHARSFGMKQVLWFETERVTPGTDLDLHHPEWLITLPGNGNRMFNLGIPAACAYLTDLISQRITEYGVDFYRQDFNFEPLPYWQSQDAPDRKGMTEIKYVEGFLAYWDGLRVRHTNMFIDCCASGGRRDDLEVLRRAVPLWESDWTGDPLEINYAISYWIPYHGTGGIIPYDHDPTYLYRAHMGLCHIIGPDPANDSLDWPLIRKLTSQEKQVMPCFLGDYYPLTPWSLDNGRWLAWQYDRPDLGYGMIQVFRRPNCADTSQVYRLSGLEAKAAYRVHDFDTNLDSLHTGAELMGTGLTFTLPEKPQSALLMYRKLEHK